MRAAAMTRAKTLLLPADLDGVAAASLFEVLSSSVGTDVIIDGSRVERIGGLCLQILLAAISDLEGGRRRSRIHQSFLGPRRRARTPGNPPPVLSG